MALRCDVIRLSGTLTSRHTARCKADEDIMLVYSSCFPSSREFLEPTQRLRIAHLSLFHPSLLSTPIQPAFVPTTFLLPRALIMSTIISPPCPKNLSPGLASSPFILFLIIHSTRGENILTRFDVNVEFDRFLFFLVYLIFIGKMMIILLK